MRKLKTLLHQYIVRDMALVELASRLEEAGYDYSLEHLRRALLGHVDIDARLLRGIVEVLELDEEEVRELTGAHLMRGEPPMGSQKEAAS